MELDPALWRTGRRWRVSLDIDPSAVIDMRSPSRLLGVLSGVGAALVAGGCAPQAVGMLGMITTRSDAAEARILEQGVEGEHCTLGAAGYVDYGAAAADALRGVPGSNVLLNARFTVSWYYFWKCERVTGDAGVLLP